jgi:hypothetical protein
MHVPTVFNGKILSIGVSEGVDPGVAVLPPNSTVLVPASIIKPALATPLHPPVLVWRHERDCNEELTIRQAILCR